MQQVGGSLGVAFLNTIATSATTSYVASHGHVVTPAAVVHGFTSAFAIGVGIMTLALIVVATLIRPSSRDSGSSDEVYDDEPPTQRRAPEVAPAAA
jgi:hypothetical protein